MIRDLLLPEFDREMATTRELLERIPDAHLGWRPHARSYTLGELGTHIARLPTWAVKTLTDAEFDTNPPDGTGFVSRTLSSTADIVAYFGSYMYGARAALLSAPDEAFAVPWSLKKGGVTIFTMPRADVFRSFFMCHVVHHRGQLTVYLRMLDVPLPQIYGPTADAP
jgi:uncharacterized damage-inducible protein DinB